MTRDLAALCSLLILLALAGLATVAMTAPDASVPPMSEETIR